MKINTNIAEFVGMHIGDGSLYKTKNYLVWELRGDLKEENYYNKKVSRLLKSIFGLEFKPKFRSGGKNGCLGIQTSKKIVSSLLVNLGFVPGRKTHTVKIPEYIKNSSKKIKYAFIKGYFDTDGYIRFEKINKNKKYTYPKIEFCTASEQLREDLFKLLKELNFKPYKWGKKDFRICLAGKSNLKMFIDNISPNNSKHVKKYEFWLKNGHCPPNKNI